MPDNRHNARNSLDAAAGDVSTPCQGVAAPQAENTTTLKLEPLPKEGSNSDVDREARVSTSKKKPMKLTPANVSRLLTAAGHSKRTAYASRIRGMKNYSAGFTCKLHGSPGALEGEHVAVEHRTDGYDSAPFEAKLYRVKCYLPALTPHFDCALVGLKLHVKAKNLL